MRDPPPAPVDGRPAELDRTRPLPMPLTPKAPRGRGLGRQGDTRRTNGRAQRDRLQRPAALKEIDRSVHL